MAASNTTECLRELVGRQVVGILRDALPLNRGDLRAGTRTLVLNDGTGFTFNTRGAFWRETAEDIRRVLDIERKRLEEAQATYEAILAMAGDSGRRTEAS